MMAKKKKKEEDEDEDEDKIKEIYGHNIAPKEEEEEGRPIK